MNDVPACSVIIVTYNGASYVIDAVTSVVANTCRDLEVIVVDNGSTDDSVAKLTELFKNDPVSIIALDKNYGPAHARNVGAARARGAFIAFLDNDTKVHPAWMTEGLALFADDDIGIVQCKLLIERDHSRYDYAGDYLSPSGFLVRRAEYQEHDHGQYDRPDEIFSAKSAGMFIRTEAFRKAGGFDDDYFIYVEETDLAWRIWLAGYRAVFAPRSIVYHHFGTSNIIIGKKQSRVVYYHGTKNYIATVIKCASFSTLCWMLPQHLFGWMGYLFYRLVTLNFIAFAEIFRGMMWCAINCRALVRKRRAVQRARAITDAILFKKVMRRRSLFYQMMKVLRWA